MKYSQFCPIAKATEVLGDRWTLLIVREALMGATRFSEFQRGLGSISTAVLTERLKSMAENGLLVRRSLNGKRGFEYFPTPGCKELLPIIVSLVLLRSPIHSVCRSSCRWATGACAGPRTISSRKTMMSNS